MPTEIILTVLMVFVALLISLDLVRNPGEDLHDQADAAGGMTSGSSRGTATGAVPRERAGTGVTDSGQPPEDASPAASGAWEAGNWPERQRRDRSALTNWPVRPHLFLLTAITAIAAVMVTLCLTVLVGSLRSASFQSRVGSIHDGAIRSASIAGALAIVITALALWSAIIVIRSMLQPLHRLRTTATDVADARMPDAIHRIRQHGGRDVPLDVESIAPVAAGEMAEVGQAFDRIHGEALRLAATEAATRANLHAMLASLSHRAAAIADRQVQFIDDLERGEPDTTRLAKLYQLGRLTGRIHRFSQNLLVLAGHELADRWGQPMALVDVIRAAVSEIGEYERVSLIVDPGIAVRAPVTNGLAHMLAELAENATSLSAAGTPVVISGRWLPAGGVLIGITDQGFGMSAEEMAHANWRLENPPPEIAAYRSMGLSVVGRLASRYGIRVRLHPAECGGLMALVWLPDNVIMHQDAAASSAAAAYGSVRSGPGE